MSNIRRKIRNPYSIQKSMEDFPAKRLAKGLEKTLVENLSYGVEPVEMIDDIVAEGDSSGEMVRIFSEYVPENGRYSGYEAEIFLDQYHGNLIAANCNCRGFADSYHTCSHVECLLMSYFWEEYGEEIFEDTEIKEELVGISGVEDPFIPGILRRTSAPLQYFRKKLEDESGQDKPLWLQEPKNPLGYQADKKAKAPALLSTECILMPIGNNLLVELKIGPKRHYVVSNQMDLMEAYLGRKRYTLGKNSYPVGPNAFTEDSEEVMEFFAQLYDSYRSMGREDLLVPYQHQKRYYSLMGRELDAFMEMMEGKNISLTEDKNTYNCRVQLQREAEAYQVDQEMYGATIHMLDETYIGCGINRFYIRQKDYIISLPKDQMKYRKMLIKAGKADEELYIQEKDLPAILGGIASVDPSFACVKLDHAALDNYIPPKPEIKIYLDYPQDCLISCKLEAYYPKADKTFSIFDMEKGKRIRNFQAERSVGEAMWQYFNAYDEQNHELFYSCNEDQLYIFLTETIPMISDFGEVFISDALKRIKVRPAGDVVVGVQVDAGGLLVSVGSDTMDKQEMIEILSSYQRKKRYTRLKNGQFISFKEEDSKMWDTLSDTFRNYGKKNPEAMKLPLFRALYMEELLEERDGFSIEKDQSYRDLIHQIGQNGQCQYEIPASLDAIMRPYQKDGFQWMHMLKDNGFGGILADDMGLGKTLQVLSFLLSEKESGKSGRDLRTLIVTPASLVYNWKKEIEKFTPDLKCRVIAGSVAERRVIFGQLKAEADCADIYITSYDLLKRDIAEYDGIHFANEIIDEAQYIKNQNTQAAQGVRLIDSDFRMALTGTPIENRLSELWSIFDYLMPGFLYKYSKFRTVFETPVVTNKDEYAVDRLRRMIHPFILRRLKKDVLKDLPDKLEEVVTVQMENEQRKIYDAHANRLRLFLENQNEQEFQQGKLAILAELTKLRQICCGPEVFLENYKGGNAKKEACMELIHQAIDGGHKVLLFSQFTSILDELGKRLSADQIEYHRIDGSTSKKERMNLVSSFQKDDVPVFCISLKAGGTGLNLTAADIVIHFDPWWNVAAQNQATDRTHRIGQENRVVVYKLIAEKTIEEQIVKLQNSKAKLADDVLTGEGVASIIIDKDSLLDLL